MLRFLRRAPSEANSKAADDLSSSENKKASGKSALPVTPRMPRNERFSRTPVSASKERQYHADRLKDVVAATMTDGVDGLKAFESCIEASDALASTSTSSSQTVDNSTGLPDCSVLVSADGELLIIPQQQKHSNEKEEEEAEESNKSWSWNQNNQSNELGEEYDSAVFLGNDLPDLGDKAMNGLSAKGWSVVATSLALKQSADNMGDLSGLMGGLVAAKKSSAKQNQKTIGKLWSKIVGVQQSELNASQAAQYKKYLQRNFRMKKVKNQQNVDLEVSPDRVGPFNQTGGTIAATLKALKNYHHSVSESELKRALSMTDDSGALMKFQNATKKSEERVRRRQFALQETMSRIKAMEDYLRDCKINAEIKWNKVHETEMLVTKLVEEKMTKQRKLREEELDKEEVQKIGESEEYVETSSSEILDMISAATASMEEGSFAPVLTLSTDNSSVVTDDASPTFVPPEDMEYEMDSRYEFEVMCRLPELRVKAVAADEAVEQAATSLLSILSDWDTTSRSAQVAAETCLLSSGNAQASCLRSIIASERESIEERLKLLEELESVANKIDVRADVDSYITTDKTKQGRRSYRGDFDDGGIASALSHLHSDNLAPENDGDCEERDSGNEEETEEELEDPSKITSEHLEETLECFFRSEAPPKKELEANINILCAIGKAKSSKYATKRSTMCYAMNTKRSTNAQISSLGQFEGLCRIFDAILSGCDTSKDGGISSAVLLMGLSEHFYVKEGNQDTFIKSRLAGHSIWDKDSFWDRALSRIITEKLNLHSSVLSTFEKASPQTMASENKERSEWTETPKTKWHDLTEAERYQAVSQVNAIVFAQVSAMSDSMLELCGDKGKTSAFVRRVCVKNQLPISQRTALLRHLTGGAIPASS